VPVEAPTARRTATLQGVEIMVGLWCGQTDPALLSGVDAAGGVERLAVVIRQLTAKQAVLAARAAECNSYSKRSPSPEDWLARQNGTTLGEAKKAVDTARRLRSCPVTADAFERGDLSVGEADAISAAAVVDPSSEDGLVARARSSHDLGETRERAERVRRAARKGEDPAARRARLRAKRRWNEFDDDEMKAIAARFLPEEWARVAPVVDAYARAIFERARKAGITDPSEAYRADAVLAALAALAAAGEAIGLDGLTWSTQTAPATATDATGVVDVESTDPGDTTDTGETTRTAAHDADSTTTGDITDTGETTRTAASDAESTDAGDSTGTAASDAESAGSELEALLKVRPDRIRWNVCILVDAIALKRGYATATETCEIPGFGPVDVDWVSRILPESLVDVLVHDLVDIRAHATMTRYRKTALDKALQARDKRCVVPGCKRRRRLQADHRHDFAKDGPTAYDNLERLCEKHHHDKTHRRARIERVGDEWHWYPPPPQPGEPEPPPGSIPWRAPVGEHLTAFDLTDLPDASDPSEPDGTLPFDSGGDERADAA
jgi:hypothetical protein